MNEMGYFQGNSPGMIMTGIPANQASDFIWFIWFQWEKDAHGSLATESADIDEDYTDLGGES